MDWQIDGEVDVCRELEVGDAEAGRSAESISHLITLISWSVKSKSEMICSRRAGPREGVFTPAQISPRNDGVSHGREVPAWS